MLNGDPRSYIDSWAVSDDITVFGAWGPIEKGHKRVTDTLRWVGSRFAGADELDVDVDVDVEHTVIACSGDLAYAVGFERSHVGVDGRPLCPGGMRCQSAPVRSAARPGWVSPYCLRSRSLLAVP
jgi:hypothetical protein